ncbi:MAGE-domain-containing protein [Butyriboletus roseoflavus]|nr:MAGE-domain-containing protein [Butyriboletus roseoflavus]
MPRAGPSRTQPQPSQYHSQRVRGRRANTNDGDDNEHDAPEMDPDDDMNADATQARGADADDHLNKKARDLVRLALFTEHKRVPLRREDINKKILGSHTRSFNAVLLKAQGLLRKTFAMELVELQARNYRDQDPAEDLQNATGVKKRATAAGSKTYILRSILDTTIIEQAALSHERLLEEELADGPDNDDDDDDIPHNYGSVIAWSTADQLAALGLLHVILALILVNGRAISELDLRANLKRLRISPSGTIPSNAQSTHRSIPFDTFLQHLVRQGYLDRVRLGDTKSTTGKRRGRVSATQGNGNAEDNPQAYEWRWGNRAHGEVGERAVGEFMGEFMVQQTRVADVEEEEEGAGAGAGASGGRRPGKQKQKEGGMEKRLETTVKAIERAAGGNLTDVK